MLAYLFYLLQPLDIGCFAALKCVYSIYISDFIRLGINYINKIEFLQIYSLARAKVFSIKNILNGFAVVGLVLYKPNQVL